MNIEFMVPVVLFLVSLAMRCGYELLKDAHKINPENKPIFAVILTVMCILWASWFTLCPRDPYRIDLPGPLRWMGLAIVVSGMVLAVGALVQLRGVENIDHLVTSGLFRRIRHPMYVGFVAWILGWSVFHGAMVSLGIGLIGVVCVLWWRHLEEARLEVQFGTTYLQYKQTTWF